MLARGFTLVELVVIIMLLGILAAVAVPRFFDLDGYRTRAAYDEVAGALRYAQKLAVASGCPVRVVVTATGYSLQQDPAACNGGNFAPIAGHPVNGNLSVGAALDPVTLIFDAMGRSDTGTNITVGGTEAIIVVAETGYVDAP